MNPAMRAGPGRVRVARRKAIWVLERRLWRRRYERERCVSFGEAMRIHVRLGDAAGREIFVYGTSEYHLGCILERLVAPGDTVVDMGANIGEHTLRAARRTGPTGRVFALEPQPDVFRTLERNVVENGFEGRVTLVPAAASDRSGDGVLYQPRRSENSGLATLEVEMPRAGPALASGDVLQIRVPLIRLDEVLSEHPAQRVSVIKVDVEGHERAALAGADRTIAASRPAILFEADANASAWDGRDSIATFLRDRDYAIFGIVAAGGRPYLDGIGPQSNVERLRERWKGSHYPINLVALDRRDPRTEALCRRDA